MELLTIAATWALGAFTLMVALSLVMVPVVAYFIFKSRKDFFDGFNASRKRRGDWSGDIPKSRRAPPKPPHNPHK